MNIFTEVHKTLIWGCIQWAMEIFFLLLDRIIINIDETRKMPNNFLKSEEIIFVVILSFFVWALKRLYSSHLLPFCLPELSVPTHMNRHEIVIEELVKNFHIWAFSCVSEAKGHRNYFLGYFYGAFLCANPLMALNWVRSRKLSYSSSS